MGRKPLQRNARTAQHNGLVLKQSQKTERPPPESSWPLDLQKPLDLRATGTDEIANPALCSFSLRDPLALALLTLTSPSSAKPLSLAYFLLPRREILLPELRIASLGRWAHRRALHTGPSAAPTAAVARTSFVPSSPSAVRRAFLHVALAYVFIMLVEASRELNAKMATVKSIDRMRIFVSLTPCTASSLQLTAHAILYKS